MAAFVREKLPNVRHQMWNGQWRPAIARVRTIYQGACEAATRIGAAARRTPAAISQASSGSTRLSRRQPEQLDQLCTRVPTRSADLKCACRVRDESRHQSAHGQTPADVLDRRRGASSAAGPLRSARCQTGHPTPREVSEISPNIAGSRTAKFVTAHPQC